MVFLLQLSRKGGIHDGKDNNECAGISSTDEYQPSKGVQVGKDTRIFGNSCCSRILIPVEAYKEWLFKTSIQK